MDVIQQEVFPMSLDQIQEQYNRWNTDPKKVKECEKILEEWYQKQPHFPEKFMFENIIERAFQTCCFRMDLCKKKLENYFSYKNYFNELYDVFDPKINVLLPSERPLVCVPMPKLGPHLDRIWVCFFERKNFKHMNLAAESCLQTLTGGAELIFRYEKTCSFSMVADCKEYGSNLYFKPNLLPAVVKWSWFAYHACNVKVQGIHLINLNPVWQMFINILSTFIPQKLMKRLHIHDNYESLYRAVSKDYLPKEFGGTEPSISPILEKWDRLFVENRQYLAGCGKYVADESKRMGKCPHNAMFGVEGSFRKLEID